jgi:CDGSH-type Zn-finger protein
LADKKLYLQEGSLLLIKQVKKSMSSSVEYNSKAPEGENQLKEKPKILPLANGPYYLINDMQPKIVENLQNSKGEPLSTVYGVALCRCGASKNKPFCDGIHRAINFKDDY